VSLSRSGTLSQPRTPVSGVSNFLSGSSSGAGSLSYFPMGGMSLSLGSRSVGGGATPGGSGGLGLNVGSGSASAGKTMREYDESLRDLKKENFNLKLRIYFLEERLGSRNIKNGGGAASGAMGGSGEAEKDVQLSNMDLKVRMDEKKMSLITDYKLWLHQSNSWAAFQIQVESLKYDVQEKSDLLKEAGHALEQLENKISRLTIEREEERSGLEARLQQLEDDLNDSQLRLFEDDEPRRPQQQMRNELFSPTSSDSKDEDERLLREVEAEMARPVPFNMSSASLMLPLTMGGGNDDFLQQLQSTPIRPIHLAVVEERAVAEAEVEELNRALQMSEERLEEVSGGKC
jgi:hypothetical protein